MTTAKRLSDFPVLDTPTSETQLPVMHLGKNRKIPIAGIKKALTLAKDDVGLGNVDNTADQDKPISIATQQALDGKSNRNHQHSYDEIAGLSDVLDGKADRMHTHPEFQSLAQEIAAKADQSHTHQIQNIVGLSQALTDRPTSAEVSQTLSGYVSKDDLATVIDSVNQHVDTSNVGQATLTNYNW